MRTLSSFAIASLIIFAVLAPVPVIAQEVQESTPRPVREESLQSDAIPILPAAGFPQTRFELVESNQGKSMVVAGVVSNNSPFAETYRVSLELHLDPGDADVPTMPAFVHVVPNPISLNGRSQAPIRFVVPIPEYLDGDYRVFLDAATPLARPAGKTYLGVALLEGTLGSSISECSANGVEFDSSLKITEDEYRVDVSCRVSDVDGPQILLVVARPFGGEEVVLGRSEILTKGTDVIVDSLVGSLAAGQYTFSVVLVDENGTRIGGMVSTLLTISGRGFSIEDAMLSAPSYRSGEVATVFLSGDLKSGADINGTLELLSGGRHCAEAVSVGVMNLRRFDLPIVTDCIKPTVRVSLSIDGREGAVEFTKTFSEHQEEKQATTAFGVVKLTFIFGILMFALFFILTFLKGKKVAATMILVASFGMGAHFAHDALAATGWWHIDMDYYNVSCATPEAPVDYFEHYASISVPGNSYAPGALISGATVTNDGDWFSYSIPNGPSGTFSSIGTLPLPNFYAPGFAGDVYGSGTLNVASSNALCPVTGGPGWIPMGCPTCWTASQYLSGTNYLFTVSAAPIIHGTCATTHYSCLQGTAINPSEDATAWYWICQGAGAGAFDAGCFEAKPMASCPLPWGGSIPHGSSVTAYQSASVPFPGPCVSETRNCTNGVLSGSYTNQNCSVGGAASCPLPWGGSIPHGSSVTAYQSASVPFPGPCVSESRNCSNGSLGGSYVNQNCSVAAPLYTYTFDGNGATTPPSPGSRTLAAGSGIVPPTNPSRTGYSFTGWSIEIPAMMPVGGGTSFAQWTPLACGNGANNPPTCNSCTLPLVWNIPTNSCINPLGVTANPVAPITLPPTAFTITYAVTNGPANCRLLDGANNPLTAYAACTGSIGWNTPAVAGSYGYRVQANKIATGETVSSNLVTVTVNPAAAPTIQTFSATPNPVDYSTPTTLNWTTTGTVTECRVNGTVRTNGWSTGNLTSDTNYQLICYNGASPSSPVDVTVRVRPDISVTGLPATVTSTIGPFPTLTFSMTPNATQCWWSRGGTGNVGGNWTDATPVSGSPWTNLGNMWNPGTYIYSFRCQSAGGAATEVTSGPHTLTVNAPAPVPSITPVGTSFVGEMIVNNTLNVPSAFTIRNSGDPGSTLTITSFSMGGTHPGDFVVTGCATPINLAANASTVCGVNFTPATVGPRAATITISGNVSANYNITGNGINPINANWDMGRVVVNRPREKSFPIENLGPIAMPAVVIGTAGAGGEFQCSAAQAGPFAATCPIGDLNGFQTKQVWIRFSPTAPGVVNINATVSATGYANLPTIPIRGTGVPGNFQFCEPGEAGCQ